MTLPKLALIPSGYQASKIYSALPTNGGGDFAFSRSGTATRVNKNGFIETVDSNVPRLDYSDSSCPSLLLEPQRTNLILYSEAFTGTNWFSTNTTLTPNNIISPSGKLNGNKLERTSTSGSYRQHLISKAASAITYTTSVFVKKGSDNYFAMRAQGSYPQRVDVRFRFDTEEIYDVNAVSPFVLLDYGVEKHSNGWYRIYFTYTTDTHTYVQTVFSPRATDGNIDSSDTSNSSYAYVWGAQTEEGSYPTSYIPTEGQVGGVTRTVDSCLNGGDANLFNDSEGTLFVDLENFDAISQRITLSSGFASNRIIFLFYGSSSGSPNKIRFYLQRESQIQVDSLYNITYTFNQKNKIAFRYKQNDFKAYINGVEVFSDTNGNTPIGLSRLDFSQENQSSDFIVGKINDTRYYNTALTDAELQALTTL